MKKKPIIIGAAAFLLIAAGYFGAGSYYEDKFLPNTMLDGIDISNDTVAQAKKETTAAIAQAQIEIVENGETILAFTPADLGVSIDNTEKLEAMKAEQNGWDWPFLLFQDKKEETDLSGVSVDETAFGNILAEMQLENESRTAPVNATVVKGTEGYEVAPETAGNKVDLELLKASMLEAIIAGGTEIDLMQAYQQPTLTADDPILTETLQKLDELADTVIQYTISGQTETVPQTAIVEWLGIDENGEVSVNRDGVAAYLQGLSDTYSTYSRTRDFLATDGDTVQVPPGTYGWTLAVAAETDNLIEYVLEGEDVTVTPNYNGTGYHADGADIGTTYVEVDLSSQHMWYYRDGVVALETDIVSGHPLSPTPTGVFYIWNKEEDAVLKGYNPRTEKDYESPVEYWMPVDWTGIGIHDSSWQPAYGGEYWLTAGSNGCVNTPPGVMAELYGMIGIGVPVVIHS
ncbi:L,D-transpeptidase family protein [uncultured Trichococcus sp.]|uniref:L,D-transpeptidase family protein n=1 Tax=uncultured Trichococcus sp. TaxID=189665 RepID=UPI0029C81BD1|nr:L,D-transpeptidase family protein [uncultured Trichococcus sp.]